VIESLVENIDPIVVQGTGHKLASIVEKPYDSNTIRSYDLIGVMGGNTMVMMLELGLDPQDQL
jgi:hypothetical protein